MMATSSGAFFSNLLFLCLIVATKSDYIPVLVIGSDSDQIPASPAAPNHKLTTAEFQNDYFNKLVGKGPLAVFCQDTLSLEDFDNYGNAYSAGAKRGAFQNLNVLLEKNPFLLLPAVQRPAQSLKKLEEKWNVLELKNVDSSLQSLDVKITSKTLILVQLPTTEIATDRAAALTRNDEIVGRLTNELKELSDNFTVMYTAQRSSWTLDQDDHVRISRQILAVEEKANDTNGFIIVGNSTLIYARSITFHVLKYNNLTYEFNIAGPKFDTYTEDHENKTTLNFTIETKPSKPELEAINITFNFEQKIGNWYLDDIELHVVTANFTDDFQLTVKNVWAPRVFSYTCNSPGFFYSINETVALSFVDLQIQPFLVNDTAGRSNIQFGDTYDCVGFFSIAIWMSIFVTLMFIIILAFGIQQVMSINTMDRFDDPKGKSITVPNVD